MRFGGLRFLLCSCTMVLCLVAGTDCRRSSERERAAPRTEPLWTLSLSSPVDHLDMVAREPMIVEHPDGTLFVGGFGAPRMGQQQTKK